ncbi:helix-turn-helix domain-containing protein [Gracilibacillus salinarum]|uniref:Helix-turn-helix domain-containing protein n=1 Tax=Gracilibacillus salinarum TaxID=2932255 RepID=A0ABY4GRW7_9BACI|nr:helix-turn-helix domain-containing protein [Gracilibacillus salinarum]UOQ86941.1 helix-turn-helix domain-containing protein [Gracilibacillus salinarum]
MDKEKRDQCREEIANHIIFSNQVLELLDISRSRLNQYVNAGKIIPIVAAGRNTVYLREDIEAFKRDHLDKLDKDLRYRNK